MKVAHELETQELSEKFILENTYKTIMIVNRKTEFNNYLVTVICAQEDLPQNIVITSEALEKFSKSLDYHIIYS